MDRYAFLGSLIKSLEAKGWEDEEIGEAVADVLQSLRENERDESESKEG